MFSINYFSFVDEPNTYIYFGGYENTYAASDSDITWFNLTGSGFWSINCPAIFYGDSNETIGSLGEATLDTGSSFAMVPKKIIDGIVKAYGKIC